MRHRLKKNNLGRKTAPRQSLIRSLAISLIIHGKIKTTLAKAKTVRPFIEKLVTRAKNNKLANRRILIAKLNNHEVVNKLINDYGKKYAGRKGGYLRIIKLGQRKGDGAESAILEFIDK